MKAVLIFLVSWATISLMVEGYTGYLSKGEIKKSIIANLKVWLFFIAFYIVLWLVT